MENPKVNPFNVRYYIDGPEKKSLETCAGHGYDHKGYGWSKQIDPRWSDAQIDAYLNAYNSGS